MDPLKKIKIVVHILKLESVVQFQLPTYLGYVVE